MSFFAVGGLWGEGGFAVCGGVFFAGLALWRLFGGFLGCRVWLGMNLRIGGGLRSVCRYGGWAGAEVRRGGCA